LLRTFNSISLALVETLFCNASVLFLSKSSFRIHRDGPLSSLASPWQGTGEKSGMDEVGIGIPVPAMETRYLEIRGEIV
jgi:hypothetical protein